MNANCAAALAVSFALCGCILDGERGTSDGGTGCAVGVTVPNEEYPSIKVAGLDGPIASVLSEGMVTEYDRHGNVTRYWTVGDTVKGEQRYVYNSDGTVRECEWLLYTSPTDTPTVTYEYLYEYDGCKNVIEVTSTEVLSDLTWIDTFTYYMNGDLVVKKPKRLPDDSIVYTLDGICVAQATSFISWTYDPETGQSEVILYTSHERDSISSRCQYFPTEDGRGTVKICPTSEVWNNPASVVTYPVDSTLDAYGNWTSKLDSVVTTKEDGSVGSSIVSHEREFTYW